jgi:phosphatidylinositol glycan class S
LHITRSGGSNLSTNAFLIPQWGGVVVKNLNFTEENVILTTDSLHETMKIFISQLRTLMGVKNKVDWKFKELLPGFSLNIEQDSKFGITDWELDALLRTRSIQNMMDSVSTLQSFAQLLKSLETIPVLDHISRVVEHSLNSLKSAGESLRICDYDNASINARNAILSSEKAFFDPTMVSLLYFPAEHLLAIYMPFFVPILIPMISTTIKEYKFWKANRSKSKTE